MIVAAHDWRASVGATLVASSYRRETARLDPRDHRAAQSTSAKTGAASAESEIATTMKTAIRLMLPRAGPRHEAEQNTGIR
jgi:hypothetical protein